MNVSRLLSLLAILATSLVLGGCASITGGTQQSVSVETRQETTQVSGAAYDYPNMIQVMMGQMTKVGYTEGHATTHTTTNPAGGPPGATQTSVTPAGVTTTETLTLTPTGSVASNANPTVAPVSLDAAKNQCMELGIKPQTEAFGQCVMRIAK